MFTPVTAVPAAVAAIGAGLVAMFVDVGSIDAGVQAAGKLTVIIAVMVICTCSITKVVKSVNRPADKAYELGFEMGRDAGWMEARKHDRPQAVAFLNRTEDDATELLGGP
jgi:hypothetical protein